MTTPNKENMCDVVEKRKRNVFRGRSWDFSEVATLGVVMALHLLCVFGPLTFSWDAFYLALGLYVVTVLFGVILSFHRNLSHKSFKLSKWLEYLFAYCGVHALQGNPIRWVSTHRYHHQYVDSERDPHTPTEGFWFGHIGWIFDTKTLDEKCGKRDNVKDMEKQMFYRFLRSTYILHPMALGVLLYGLGGFPYIVWGMGVRTVCSYHMTWLVNSICHMWGHQAWNTGDQSRNNWWMAMLTFGEGWHNNHHAFEYSAKAGVEWWQIDISWCVVRVLEAIGLATNVKLPTKQHMQRMTLSHVKLN